MNKLKLKTKLFVWLGLVSVALSGCAGKFADVEELSNGNHLLKSSVSTMNGASEETARAKAEQEADKICQRDGRALAVKNITTTSNPGMGLINSEIEFNCEPKVYQRRSR